MALKNKDFEIANDASKTNGLIRYALDHFCGPGKLHEFVSIKAVIEYSFFEISEI